MPAFQTLWNNHPGRADVCDRKVFPNQCAMRMGEALTKSNVNIPTAQLRTCVDYNRRRFKDHAPGHVRAAQQLATLFMKQPSLLGPGVSGVKYTGTISDNAESLRGKNGVIFIRNGWDTTDHIDVFKGTTFELKGGQASYRERGEETWFWAI